MTPIREPPQRECFEFAFRDDEGQRRIPKLRVCNTRREVKHVAVTWRAEIFLFWFDLALGVDSISG